MINHCSVKHIKKGIDMSHRAIVDTTIDRVTHWLLIGDTGRSSMCMLANFYSHENVKNLNIYEGVVHPYDSADFYRCHKLLEAVPEFREQLPIMRNVSPYWNTLVDHWSELEELLQADLADNKYVSRTLYDRMKELYKPITAELEQQKSSDNV